jgi:hypothetical protein
VPDSANAKTPAQSTGSGARDRPQFRGPEVAAAGPYGEIARLQRLAGNRAVAGMFATPSPVPSEAQPLDPSLRASLELRFHSDFSAVRIHAGERSAALARSHHANAFTQDQNIVFAAGRFAPHEAAGRRLLLHELVHVIQQSRPGGSYPGAAHEREAESAANGSGYVPVALTSVPGAIQCQPQQSPTDAIADAKKELTQVQETVEQEATNKKLTSRLLVHKLADTKNVLDAATKLEGAIKGLDSAKKDFAAALATAEAIAKDLASNADKAKADANQLAKQLKTVQQNLDKARAEERDPIVIADLVKAAENIAASKDITKVKGDFAKLHGNVNEGSKRADNLPDAARRIVFVLRYFAAINTSNFAGAPDKSELKKIGKIDDLNRDLELVFEKGASSLPFFNDLAERFQKQIDQRTAIDQALPKGASKKETAPVPAKDDVLSYFATLKTNKNDEVIAAYQNYAKAFFQHRGVSDLNQLRTSVAKVFAAQTSLAGVRGAVCAEYAVLGDAVLKQADAKFVKFILAIRASDDEVRRDAFNTAHAVAIMTRQGATLFVSNDEIENRLEDAIGPDAVAWENAKGTITQGEGSTVDDAFKDMMANIATRKQKLGPAASVKKSP